MNMTTSLAIVIGIYLPPCPDTATAIVHCLSLLIGAALIVWVLINVRWFGPDTTPTQIVLLLLMVVAPLILRWLWQWFNSV